MSCSNCNKSNCSCSDNCPTLTSDITTFDGVFNIIEVPCDASLNDVLALLEEFTINITTNVSTFSFAEGNCLELPAGNYTLQQVLDELIDRICNIPCPPFVSISQGEGDTLVSSASGGLAPYSYQWNIQDNAGYLSIVGSSTDSFVVLDVNPGLVDRYGLVKLTLTDSNGCVTTDTFLWNIPLLP